jgi:glycosyltransferase involved in cell wall biosynthesis
MRIGLINHDFPPVNRIGAMRVYSFAKAWIRMGHDVTVFTIEPLPGVAPVGGVSDFPELSEMTVYRLPFFGGLPSSVASGVPVKVEIKIGPQGGLVWWKKLLRRAFRSIGSRMPVGFLKDPGLLSLRQVLEKLEIEHRANNFDVLLTSFPTPAAHFAGSWFNRKYGVPWVADYRDLWSGGHLYRAGYGFQWIQRFVEHRLLGRSALVLVINEVHEKLIGLVLGRKDGLIIAPNGFDEDDYPFDQVDHRVFATPGRRRLVYTGTVFAQHRFPTVLLESLVEIKSSNPEIVNLIVVEFYSSDGESLALAAKAMAVDDLVVVHGHVTRREIVKIQSEADALLFCDWSSPEDPGHMSGKIFEYLGAGRPVVSIGGRCDSLPSKLIESTGIGVSCWSDKERLKAVLVNLAKGDGVPFAPNLNERDLYRRNRIAALVIDEIQRLIERLASVRP